MDSVLNSSVNSNAIPAANSNAPLPFRQQLLWSACILLFMTYVSAVLYFFLMSAPFRYFVVHRANTLFALPYILSLLVVLLCLAPCSPTPARPQLDAVITSSADCALVVLVLLEWATCLALVLVTLIAVHDHLSYVSPDGLILPTDGVPVPSNPSPTPIPTTTTPYGDGPMGGTWGGAPVPNGITGSGTPGDFYKPAPGALHSSGDGISHDAFIVLIIPILLMYCLFNCILHLYSCIEATWRTRNHYTDLD